MLNPRDSRIPSVNVANSTTFLYGHKKSNVFDGLIEVCRKKRKGVLLAVQLYSSKNPKQMVAVGVPNKDLNCFELINIPPQYQRKNAEKPIENHNFKPSSGQAQNAKIYLASLPTINPAKISHPLAPVYHKEIARNENITNFYIPESQMTAPLCHNVAADGLLLSHG